MYEYYDFALLGFFSEEISSTIFPSGPGTSAIISLYSLFAVGFIARPFGGIVFGYFGDRYGRNSSLRMAMILMSFPTFLTGCIPGYDYIGWWAPLILLLLRVLQGLSTGGENSSASIYIYETAPPNKRAFWLSIFGICSSGTLIASLAHVILQNILNQQQITHWGWRIPFLFGIGLFVFSLWAKKWLKTTDTFANLETSPYVHRNPIGYVCSHNRGILFKFILASSLQHGSTYLIFVFLPSYLSSEVMRGNSDGWIDEYAYTINCVNSIIFLPICVLIGYFTDKIGTLPFLIISCIIVTFISPFVFYGLAISTNTIMNWFLQFLLVLACVPIWGCIFYWYIRTLLTDPRTRVTIYGAGYNLGAAVFGGTASLIGTAFVSSMGSIKGMIWSGIWMSIMAVLCIGCVLYIEFYEKRKLSEKEINSKCIPSDRNVCIGKYNKYYQKQFTSTWYLNKLDPINEEVQEEICPIENYNIDDDIDSSQENDISTYDQHNSPKLYG
eukprot:303120_1